MLGLENYIFGEIAGIELHALAYALILLLAILIAGKIASFFINRWAKNFAKRTKNTFDDAIVEMAGKAVMPVALIVALYYSFYSLGVADQSIVSNVELLLYMVSVVIIAKMALNFIDIFVVEVIHPLTAKTDNSLDDQLVPLSKKIGKVLVVLFAFISVLDRVGFDITALLAGVGVGGLALAFAARETIANLFGGISLILDKSIGIGDKIELESGTVGVVQEIGLRSTRIRTYANEEIIVPNSQIANSRIKNYARPEKKTRGEVIFTVVYGSDVDKVRKVVLQEINAHKDVLKDPAPSVIFKDMGDFSLNFIAYYWVDNFDKVWATKLDLTDAIYKRLNKEKIGIPFPTQTVYLKK